MKKKCLSLEDCCQRKNKTNEDLDRSKKCLWHYVDKCVYQSVSISTRFELKRVVYFVSRTAIFPIRLAQKSQNA